MSKPRILIIDDNDMNVRLIAFVLSDAGYDVQSAPDGAAAMTALEQQLPDLILMDLQLPGLSGLELTRRLRANPRTANVIIIAITAYALVGDEGKARSAGCNGYLTKPIDTLTLPGVIAGYLSETTR
jgi:CheY-like chemotaxis protein